MLWHSKATQCQTKTNAALRFYSYSAASDEYPHVCVYFQSQWTKNSTNNNHCIMGFKQFMLQVSIGESGVKPINLQSNNVFIYKYICICVARKVPHPKLSFLCKSIIRSHRIIIIRPAYRVLKSNGNAKYEIVSQLKFGHSIFYIYVYKYFVFNPDTFDMECRSNVVNHHI